MATGSKNAKSQSLTARVPHDIIEGMDAVKHAGESTAGFIATAMQGEITRRQVEASGENTLLSSLNALARVEEIGIKAGNEIKQLVGIARKELQRKKGKEAPEG
ncbi:YlcI/YnfO family protein [Serratia fonticola]|uniref:YlcI/YnfO family protein n=1 Tax=Serratia fonticola TaxID=47917 RepID=UPI003AB05EA6